MSLPRAMSKLICRVLIGVFVFAQIAVAAHACPGLGQSSSQAAEAQAMPGCDQMDRSASNLCTEHCHFGQQSSDTAPVPVVIAPMLALLYVVLPAADAAGGAAAGTPAIDAPSPAPPPPHAILHCVLRI
jgi:hypothetical protein